MVADPRPDEARRIDALRALQLLDSPPEPVFDVITRMAARLLRTPIALISLVDSHRQWFKSSVGIGPDLTQTPRELAFCAHAIQSTEPFIVPDARLDARFANNPMVTGEPGIRAYAGIPLTSAEGFALGTLCVIDHQARTFTDAELDTLRDLVEMARNEVLSREAALKASALASDGQADLPDGAELFQAIFEQAAAGIAMVGLDGAWLRFNAKLCSILGRTPQSLQGVTFQDITHPDDLSLDLRHVQELMDGLADQYAMEKRYLRPDGGVVWANLTVALVRRNGLPRYFIAVIDDISERKRAEASLAALRSDLEQRVVERTRDLQRSNDWLNAVLGNALNAFICVDERGHIVEWNRQAERTLGWKRSEALGRLMSELIIPQRLRDGHETGMAHLRRTREAKVLGRRLELTAQRKDGSEIPCEVTINALPDGLGQGQTLYFSFLHDISYRKQAEQALADSERRLRTIADNLPALIAYVDQDERYVFCNRTYQSWLGVDPGAAVGRPVSEVLGEAAYAQRRDLLVRASQGEFVEFDIESTSDGEVRHLHLAYLPDRSESGEVVGVFALGTDITDAKLAQHQLFELARTDMLTGLANRRAFDDALAQAVARQKRSGLPLALAFLDIDNFKGINDSLGHGLGDEVLRTFALRLTSCMRSSDVVARLAGDEFVVLLEGLKHPHEAEVIARKVIRAISAKFDLTGDLGLDVTTSLGVAFMAKHTLSPQELVDAADKALYQAKAAGKNTYKVVQTGEHDGHL
ncbi:PAS domain S-box protein [Aquabacterium sp.]|uniref:PAS domain S-box protein n=1 Tax=Aquabacterium sp. TaxID=1872578 RepID=UPI0025BA60B3|nr:PAS domain S-box protein [Aquabacterium sp.]